MKVNIFKLQLAYTLGLSFKETRLKSERFGINTSYILPRFLGLGTVNYRPRFFIDLFPFGP